MLSLKIIYDKDHRNLRSNSQQDLKHRRILVVDICACKDKGYDLASVIARKMQFEAVTSAHSSFPIGGDTLNTLLAYRLRIWHTGIIIEPTKVMPVQLPNAPRLRKNMS